MDQEHLNQILNYAESEFKLLTIDEEFKEKLYKSSTSFLKDSYNLAEGDIHYMLRQLDLLQRLIRKLPLSNINETDFAEVDVVDANQVRKQNRCTRYEHLWKDLDGTYYDNRAVVWVNYKTEEKQYRYSGIENSRKTVVLPYYPKEKIINDENMNTQVG